MSYPKAVWDATETFTEEQAMKRNFLREFGGEQQGPAPRTFAQDLGWTTGRTAEGAILHQGYYRALGLRWFGVVYEYKGRFEFYIQNPPDGFIRSGSWAVCFHAGHPNNFWMITFKPGFMPRTLSSGIQAICHVLKESIWRTFNPNV